MQTYQFTIQPLSAFGTPLAGDTLFGQLCWILRHQLGNDRLNTLLEGYTRGKPFAVISDALPFGHVPLPSVPSYLWQTSKTDRKTLKKKKWLPTHALEKPFSQWQLLALTETEVAPEAKPALERAQPHNTINRHTGTTGEGAFAPYSMSQIWHHPAMQFDLIVVLDETRLSLAECTAALDAIGTTGFGRDATIGLGKFRRIGDAQALTQTATSEQTPPPNSYLTLGLCAPQGQGFCQVRSFYQVTTRFGRHGDAAVQSGNPFKRPVLLAKAGSLWWSDNIHPEQHFIGQGLGGVANPVSTTMPETVQQGYAPVIAIHRPTELPG